MTIETLFLIVGGVLALCGSAVACTAYIGGKFEKLSERLTKLQLTAAEHVTFAICSEKRHHCPVAEELRKLNQEIRREPND